MASALLPTDTFRFLIGGTKASVGLISGYLLKEIPRTFRLSVLLRKVHAPGRLDGNFWGLGVHPRYGQYANAPRASPSFREVARGA